MAWRNTDTSFGRVSRALHWSMALLLIGQLALGVRIAGMQPGLANLWLYGLHKTVGFAALALVLVRIIWHLVSKPPAPKGIPGWERTLAKLGHLALYALMLAIPLTGWVASSASGLEVMIADRWTLPPIAPVSELLEARAFAVHGVLAKLLMALVSLHILAALKREMDGDGTLTRMLRGQ